MRPNWFVRAVLVISGGIALVLGSAILLTPLSFYTGMDIAVAGAPNVLNELMAPAGLLVLIGGFIIAGAFQFSLTQPALALAALAYLSYALSRLISAVSVGMPGQSLLMAGVSELVMGLTAVTLLIAMRRQARLGRTVTT